MEKDIEVYLRTETKKLGGLALKFVSPGFTGVMDRIVLLPGGIVLFVETKDTGLKVKKGSRQDFVKRQFIKLGMKVYEANSKEQIKKILNDL
jgi:hypothetical protein